LESARRDGSNLQAAGDDAQTAETGMNQPPRDKPVKPSAKPDRTAREAASLRSNLLKRKDQARQREKAKEKPAS
jgi:hypothetical protein